MIRYSGTHSIAGRIGLAAGVTMLASLTLTACSNAAMYQAIQQNRLQACEEIPIAQQAGCKARYQSDYKSYTLARDSLSPR